MFNAELSCFKTYSEAPALQDEYVFFPKLLWIQGCIHATAGNFQTRTMMQRDREQQRLYGE